MLEKIKLSVRMFHNVLDTEVQDNISACMLDLQRVGVSANVAKNDSNDALIAKAAELYYKWQIDYNGKGEQYERAYKNLRDSLSLCDDYADGVNADV